MGDRRAFLPVTLGGRPATMDPRGLQGDLPIIRPLEIGGEIRALYGKA